MCHDSVCIVPRTGKFTEKESRLMAAGGGREEWEGIFFQNMGNNIYYIYTVHRQLATGLGDCLVRVRGHVSDLMVKHDLIHEYHRGFCWELH